MAENPLHLTAESPAITRQATPTAEEMTAIYTARLTSVEQLTALREQYSDLQKLILAQAEKQFVVNSVTDPGGFVTKWNELVTDAEHRLNNGRLGQIHDETAEGLVRYYRNQGNMVMAEHLVERFRQRSVVAKGVQIYDNLGAINPLEVPASAMFLRDKRQISVTAYGLLQLGEFSPEEREQMTNTTLLRHECLHSLLACELPDSVTTSAGRRPVGRNGLVIDNEYYDPSQGGSTGIERLGSWTTEGLIEIIRTDIFHDTGNSYPVESVLLRMACNNPSFTLDDLLSHALLDEYDPYGAYLPIIRGIGGAGAAANIPPALEDFNTDGASFDTRRSVLLARLQPFLASQAYQQLFYYLTGVSGRAV